MNCSIIHTGRTSRITKSRSGHYTVTVTESIVVTNDKNESWPSKRIVFKVSLISSLHIARQALARFYDEEKKRLAHDQAKAAV